MFSYLVCFRWVEFNLENLINITRRFSEKNLFIVASDQMPSDHSFRVADHFEKVSIKRRLHDAVIELDNEHVLLVATEAFRDQLACLNLIIIVALLVLYMLVQTLLNFFTSQIFLRGNHSDIPTENVESLLADISVAVKFPTLMILKPWV